MQSQPQMFGANFVANVLKPMLGNQIGRRDLIVNGGIGFWNTNMVISDTAAALLQVAIGVTLFFSLSSKTFKVGLCAPVVWGIIVWLCGEGAGQLLTGGASFYTGAPGTVTIYVLLAVLLLMPERVSVASYPKIAGWLCVLGALL